MSESESNPILPSKHTSSVPLKKETVRVTVKASDAPPAVPSAALPVAPPVITSPPLAPKPMPTIALRTAGAPPRPLPTPTIAIRTASAPITPTSTTKLATNNAPFGSPTIALKTATSPLPGIAATPTAPVLPKITAQLKSATRPIATQQLTVSLDEKVDETGAQTFVNILAGAGLLAAIVVLALQLSVSSIWINAVDQITPGSWSLLLE